MNHITEFAPSEHKAMVGEKEITVRSLIPVFKNQEERKMAGQKIQDGLYQIFRKYMMEQAC